MIIGITRDNDIVLKCEHGDFEQRVPYSQSKSPFWELLAGRAFLIALQHQVTAHGEEGERVLE